MTVGVFLVVQYSAYNVSGLAAEAVAGVASLVAVAIVTTMVLWMRAPPPPASPGNYGRACRAHWRPGRWRW